jgi:hypothetical protein
LQHGSEGVDVALTAALLPFPFSNWRSRSRSHDRRGPLAADDTELILIRLGTALDANPRLFPKAAK